VFETCTGNIHLNPACVASVAPGPAHVMPHHWSIGSFQ